jgi:hypothetical protein
VTTPTLSPTSSRSLGSLLPRSTERMWNRSAWGWGKAPQPHTGEDGKDIRITIRQIVEGKK